MEIDAVSTNLIKIALFLDKEVPGSASEIWISRILIDQLKATLPGESEIHVFINETTELIHGVSDLRRKKYLNEILNSLTFQINNLKEKISYSNYSENVFGSEIARVTQKEIQSIETEIKKSEEKIGKKRIAVFKKYSLSGNQYLTQFQISIQKVKDKIPQSVLNFKDEGFIVELASDKPWSAFNTHTAPFNSKLTLNADIPFTALDLYRLASHEAYGGHHSELSHKDKLLLNEQRGEHGLIVTLSPQVFISEGIAESMYVLLQILDKENEEQVLAWQYDRLVYALQNLATFMFFDDGLSKEEIDNNLKQYSVSDESRKGILNFSTDLLFGKYAPVYYSAFNFIEYLYLKTAKKDEFIKTLFTQPCTPSLLTEEFKEPR